MRSSLTRGFFLLIVLLSIYLVQASLQPEPAPTPSPTLPTQTNTPSPTPTSTKTPTATPTPRPPTPTFTPTPTATAVPPTPTPSATPLPQVRQITTGNCCTSPYWSSDSTEVRFIDQPSPEQPLGIWGINITQLGATPYLITSRLGAYSPDGQLIAYPDRYEGTAIIERLEDGQQWKINTGANSLFFTPNGQEVLWMQSSSTTPWDTGENVIWLANVDGSNVRRLASLQRAEPMEWLADGSLLIVTQLTEPSARMLLSSLSLQDGTQTPLREVGRMQDLLLSPNRQRLVYTSFTPNIEENGIWLVDLQHPQENPQKLPFFGTYRWRDNQRLVFVPFEPNATQHTFYEYNTGSGQARLLFAGNTDLLIANNDWQISPDGSMIVLVATAGTELNGIWILEIRE